LPDLGGASGHLAVAACRRYPGLRALVFDLPQVVGLPRSMLAAEPEVAPRIEVQAGDFFTEPLPEADLYAVGRILHDWPDDRVRQQLAAVFRSVPPGSALLGPETRL